MPAPTFVAAYNSAYNSSTTPKTVSVTTQAGDIVVVYGGVENSNETLGAPSGNSISFTLKDSVVLDVNWASAYVYTGVDTTGGTNWTLSMSKTSGGNFWGFTCLVFRGSEGVGASNKANINGSAPSLSVTTTQDNSAVVVFNNDWNALDGSSRVWSTVNGITPTSGNGLETTYGFNSGLYTVYGAYYNDVGTAGGKTVGLSAPGGQKYSIVAVEIKGVAGPALASVTTDTVTNIAPQSATGNGSVDSDGGATITERGFCWNTSADPTTSNSKVIVSGTTGSYSGNITGLSDNVLYYVRAYAINSVGTSYGASVPFRNYGARGAWFVA